VLYHGDAHRVNALWVLDDVGAPPHLGSPDDTAPAPAESGLDRRTRTGRNSTPAYGKVPQGHVRWTDFRTVDGLLVQSFQLDACSFADSYQPYEEGSMTQAVTNLVK
jgi:hypothetical protein